jgi:hypothetical protein
MLLVLLFLLLLLPLLPPPPLPLPHHHHHHSAAMALAPESSQDMAEDAQLLLESAHVLRKVRIFFASQNYEELLQYVTSLKREVSKEVVNEIASKSRVAREHMCYYQLKNCLQDLHGSYQHVQEEEVKEVKEEQKEEKEKKVQAGSDFGEQDGHCLESLLVLASLKHAVDVVEQVMQNGNGRLSPLSEGKIVVVVVVVVVVVTFLPFYLSPFHLFTFSPFHLFTFSPFHLFTFSPFHLFTTSDDDYASWCSVHLRHATGLQREDDGLGIHSDQSRRVANNGDAKSSRMDFPTQCKRQQQQQQQQQQFGFCGFDVFGKGVEW